jgi:two-component system chemotaxis response regulator CheY
MLMATSSPDMPVGVKIRDNGNPDNSATSDIRPSLRILVAEDDDDVRRLITVLLRGAGYMVDEAQDGAEAWEAVEGNAYDLIVTDNSMPRMTGIDLLNKLHSAQIKTPAILVTGQIPTDELRRNPWLLIEAIVLKPFTAIDLLATVENIFNGLECAETSVALADPPVASTRPRLKPDHSH